MVDEEGARGEGEATPVPTTVVEVGLWVER
jgi:hypothetical protein